MNFDDFIWWPRRLGDGHGGRSTAVVEEYEVLAHTGTTDICLGQQVQTVTPVIHR
jgi:hypothetical protein